MYSMTKITGGDIGDFFYFKHYTEVIKNQMRLTQKKIPILLTSTTNLPPPTSPLTALNSLFIVHHRVYYNTRDFPQTTPRSAD